MGYSCLGSITIHKGDNEFFILPIIVLSLVTIISKNLLLRFIEELMYLVYIIEHIR